jgi:hypothetical protein
LRRGLKATGENEREGEMALYRVSLEKSGHTSAFTAVDTLMTQVS